MAKGPSPLTAKMRAYRARPYTDRQRMEYKPCECDSASSIPPPEVRDRAADQKLSGGYSPIVQNGPRKGQSNVCDRHFVLRSANGTCSLCLGDYA